MIEGSKMSDAIFEKFGFDLEMLTYAIDKLYLLEDKRFGNINRMQAKMREDEQKKEISGLQPGPE
jgi:hypothetical protein